VYYIKRKKAKT